jgi:hypothetical protein
MHEQCMTDGLMGVQTVCWPGPAGHVTMQTWFATVCLPLQGFSAEVCELVRTAQAEAALVPRNSAMRAIWPSVIPLKDDYM